MCCTTLEPATIEIPIGSPVPFTVKYWGKYACYGKVPDVWVERYIGLSTTETDPASTIVTIRDNDDYIEKFLLNLSPAEGGVTDNAYRLIIKQ